MTMKVGLRVVVLVTSCLLALAVHFGIFELRYTWYIKSQDASFIFGGYILSILLIGASWIWRPSRFFVGVTGLLALIFPPLLRSDAFAPVDAKFLTFVAASVLLLIGATELRRGILGSNTR